jgi:hypothetical protein
VRRNITRFGDTVALRSRQREGLSMSENAEFDKWWQDWITTVDQSGTVVEHAASANKPGDDVVPKLDDFTK